MHWLSVVTICALVVAAVVAGGALVRLALDLGDLRVAAVVGFIVLCLLVAGAAGARGRRWRRNPYW